MSNEDRHQWRTHAVEHLEKLGLSTYAARTMVALFQIGEGTAKDVSRVSDVPRTRVYDAVEELQENGLVDVRQSSPKQFRAVSAETAARRFEHEYRQRVQSLATALDNLETVEQTSEQRGVWTVTGRDAVTDRVFELVASAEEEVVFMTVEPLLDDPLVEALRAASERGVRIRLGGMSSPVETAFEDAVPNAETFESVWEWSDTPAGRMLMVDESKTLVSVLVDGDGDHPPEPRDETAIWGAGEKNSLVVVLKAVFTWQLD